MSSPTFNKDRHIKYFLRCLKTLLPHQYTAGDGGRMLLGFFVIAGLDLLGALQSSTTPEERQGYINWIYHCQHPSGGFRGFTGTKFGDDKLTGDNEAWDPANVPATFLALETLLILGDDLGRLKRRECLQWLPKLQRKDGSFGELLGAGEEIEGVLPVGALSFLERTEKGSNQTTILSPQSQRFDSLLKWLLSRQTHEMEDEDDEETDANEHSETEANASQLLETKNTAKINQQIGNLPDIPPFSSTSLTWTGFNGRLNKIADTCYCFWVTGALGIMGQGSLIDTAGLRHYLLDKTQHLIGGFGKAVGEPPDIYHSYLGMVALALVNEPAIQNTHQGSVSTISSISPGAALASQRSLVDTAIAAGVKIFCPSEFGIDTADSAASTYIPFLEDKIDTLSYLKTQQDKISWTTVITGCMFDWGLKIPGFGGWDIPARPATIFDGGDIPFEATNLDQVGMALAKCLKNPELTQNQYVYVNSFTTTQNKVLRALEQATGDKFTVTKGSVNGSWQDGANKVKER
ncbi:hypothetical protein UA08_02837 [Talaromyces atroroseus]|uniref:Prenyltransferase alpha-alpha toroid domain-containing protein n=1 Tax=Talaromyces atroroseus TaxID=1441469 RepID=A0A225B3M1_TALAT|nr:hypothetical protein UA08_02837 [Talaromyces atroroseus]OKL61886.1 hypothetical protein UA08_02837 [Talaromyces atroroseus]